MMLRRDRPTVYGDGTQSRDFTSVDNAVQANLLACHASDEVAGRVLNIACGERHTLLQLVSLLNSILGTELSPRFEHGRRGDAKHSLADIDRARTLIGFQPEVSFDEGLARTVAWFRERQERA